MHPEAIFYPLFVMLVLTFFIGIRLGKVRVRAVLKDGLNPGYFKYNRGAKPPEYMLRTEQNYANQFELPVLFYMAILVAYATSRVDLLTIVLAWSFVLSRIIHSYIHLRFNKLMWRRRAFVLGFLILIVLWVELAIQLVI